jgi:hypothetical protein
VGEEDIVIEAQFWEFFMPLFCAHVLGDFLLQNDDWVKRKKHFPVLMQHVFVLAVLSYILIGIPGAWQLVAVVFISHALIDAIKTRSKRDNLFVFLLDQCVHILILILVAFLVVRWQLYPDAGLWLRWFGSGYLDFLIFLTGAVVCIYVGGFVVGYGVMPLLAKIEARDAHDEERGDMRAVQARGFEEGGRIIGYLERALIFILVIANQAGAIGFLIAAKSVLRFGEVRDRENRMEAEYIIIGTLLSFTFGLLVAFTTKHLLTLM